MKKKSISVLISAFIISALLIATISGTQIYAQFTTDLNGDGIVDFGDLDIVALAFGTKEGNKYYNPIADLNNDKQIDIIDLVIVAMDFGKAYYDLTINVSGQGTTDPSPETYSYKEETQVNITALPDSGWKFSHWSGNATGKQNPITITMDSDKNISAHFKEIPHVTYKLYGLDFSPNTEPGQDPNKGYVISEEQLRERMETIAPYTEWVRTFGSTHGLEKAGSIAHELGLKIAAGAWLGKSSSANAREISSLITMAQAGEADMLIVGSEVLLRHDLTENQLIEYINQVKEAVPGIPIATADVYGELLEHPAVMNVCDVILPNYYPYWEGIDLDDAIYLINIRHQQIVAAAEGKPVIVSEAGWPSEGNQIGDAIPSPENASFFFLNFVSWARTENVSYWYFEAFDEPWKAKYEGPQGAHWGIWFSNSTLKPGMQDVFDNKTMPDNWSIIEIPGGPGDPTIEFTYVPPYGSFENLKGRILHVKPADYRIAVYIRVPVNFNPDVSGWWTKPYWNNPLTMIWPDGNWTCDITTGGYDSTAIEIIAFLLPFGYDPPLMNGGKTLPQELYDNAVAKVETTREES